MEHNAAYVPEKKERENQNYITVSQLTYGSMASRALQMPRHDHDPVSRIFVDVIIDVIGKWQLVVGRDLFWLISVRAFKEIDT